MSEQIQNLLNDNKKNDLRRFLYQRKCLNTTNQWLVYSFHLIQSSGLLVTAYATSVNDSNLIWAGISLNGIASLLHIYEKLNSSILKKLLNDIILIKNGKYIDETNVIPNYKSSNEASNEASNEQPIETSNEDETKINIHLK